jgi:hypothetical protein
VYLDRPAGSLSFYRVSPGGGGSSDTLTHLHTFWSSFTQEDLLPGLGVWGWRRTPGGALPPRTGQDTHPVSLFHCVVIRMDSYVIVLLKVLI